MLERVEPCRFPEKINIQPLERLRKIKEGATLKDFVSMEPHKYDSLEPYAVDILNIWHSTVMPDVRQLVKESKNQSNKLFPCEIQKTIKTVKLRNSNVHILGVAHLRRLANSSYGEIVKDYIEDTTDKGYTWLSEEGIDEIFKIENRLISTYDFEKYSDKYFYLEAKDTSGKLSEALEICRVILSYYKDLFKDLFDSKLLTQSQNKELNKILKKTIPDKKHIVTGIRIFNLTTLPEPLDMEVALVSKNGDKVDRASISVDRSKMMAETITEEIYFQKSSNKQSKTGQDKKPDMGFLCGDAHKSEVAYFLKHPKYNPHESLAAAKNLLSK
jgi:hypothetical protein